MQAAIERMLRAATAQSLPVLMPVFAPRVEEAGQQVNAWRARGITRFVVGTDKILISDCLARYREALVPHRRSEDAGGVSP